MTKATKVKKEFLDKYDEYLSRFGKLDNQELVNAVNTQIGTPGWVSSRQYYMAALYKELDNRGIDYSVINNSNGLSIKNRIYLEDKKIKIRDDPRYGDKNITRIDATIIEQTLDALGITARIAEINYRPKDTEFCLEIALGTPLESITKLHKDIAMAVASPTGDVEIEAPIPGRALVAIRMPYDKQWYETRIKAFELRQENEKNNPTTTDTTDKAKTERAEFPKTFRDYLAVIFYVIAGILDITVVYLRKLGNYIEGRDRSF